MNDKGYEIFDMEEIEKYPKHRIIQELNMYMNIIAVYMLTNNLKEITVSPPNHLEDFEFSLMFEKIPCPANKRYGGIKLELQIQETKND